MSIQFPNQNPFHVDVCLRKGSEHFSSKQEDQFNLSEIVSFSKKAITSAKNPLTTTQIKSSDLKDLKKGTTNKKSLPGKSQPSILVPVRNPGYQIPSYLYDKSHRFRLFNNDIFSHIDGLTYSSYFPDASLPSLKERVTELKSQIEFAAKYRVLTFRLSLLAYAKKNINVGKDSTICQGAYYGDATNFRNRSDHTQDKNPIDKKTVDECHISCIPNPMDNSELLQRLDRIIGKISDPKKNIQEIINEEFFHLDELSKKAINVAIDLYRNPRKNKNSVLPLYSGNQALMHCSDFIPKLESYLQTTVNQDLSILLNEIKQKHLEIDNSTTKMNSLKNELDILKVQARNASSQSNPSLESINQELKSKGKEFSTLATNKNKLNQEYIKELNEMIIDNFEILKDFLRIANDYFSEMQMIAFWFTSNVSNDEKIRNVINDLGPQESIVPLNSILGLMYNATLAMPREINGGIDAATDFTHFNVAEKLSQFSKESNPETKIDEYVNEYIELLKNTYATYGNKAQGSTSENLETIISNIDPNSTQSLHDFIIENEKSLAKHFEENVCYDEAFEAMVLGEQIQDPEIVTTPMTNFDFCNQCWVKV